MTIGTSSHRLGRFAVLALATAVAAGPAAAHNVMEFGLVRPALAHHPMGGGLVESFGQGLLSGLAHPMIGLDHLAAILAIGMIAAALGAGLALPLAFVGASILGVGLHVMLVTVPAAELLVAASVLVLGALLVARPRLDRKLLLPLVALAGLFHGYAYGESIVGAEPTPLLAYLIGLAVIQSALSIGAFMATRTLLEAGTRTAAPALRIAGLLVVTVGAAALVAAS